jgi:hypothetical protein
VIGEITRNILDCYNISEMRQIGKNLTSKVRMRGLLTMFTTFSKTFLNISLISISTTTRHNSKKLVVYTVPQYRKFVIKLSIHHATEYLNLI